MIGLLRVALVALPLTVLYASRIMWAAARRSARLPCLCEEIPRRWSLAILRAAGTRVVLENPEHIDPDRQQVLVANHVSWFDVPALAGHMPGTYRFVAKKELAKVPFFGYAWTTCGHIAIDRQDIASAIESLAQARRRLEEDRPTIIVFPEGTRSATGELRPFKKGAFVLALEAGAEVVPAAIVGSRDVMPRGSWRVRTGRTIRIRFGAPLKVEGMGMESRDALTSAARSAVQELLSGGGGADNNPDQT